MAPGASKVGALQAFMTQNSLGALLPWRISTLESTGVNLGSHPVRSRFLALGDLSIQWRRVQGTHVQVCFPTFEGC